MLACFCATLVFGWAYGAGASLTFVPRFAGYEGWMRWKLGLFEVGKWSSLFGWALALAVTRAVYGECAALGASIAASAAICLGMCLPLFAPPRPHGR